MRISDWSSDVCSSDLFRLHQLKAGFDALAVKCRADFASILDLAMLLIGDTGAKADLVQEVAASTDLSSQIGARLVHVQPHIPLFCRRIERITEGARTCGWSDTCVSVRVIHAGGRMY